MSRDGRGVVGGRKATRVRIVAYLRAHPWRTTKEIAWSIDKAPNTVRAYLRELDGEGGIRKRRGGRGQHGNTVEYALVEELELKEEG